MFHVSVQKLNQGNSLEIKYFSDVGVVGFLCVCVLFCSQASNFLHLMQLITEYFLFRLMVLRMASLAKVKVQWSAIALNSLCIFNVI